MELNEVYEVMKKSKLYDIMNRSDVFSSLSKQAQVAYFSNVLYYYLETDGQKKALSREVLDNLNTIILKSIFDYLSSCVIDENSSDVPIDTVSNIMEILDEREPLPPTKPKTEEERREMLKKIYKRAGYEYKS